MMQTSPFQHLVNPVSPLPCVWYTRTPPTTRRLTWSQVLCLLMPTWWPAHAAWWNGIQHGSQPTSWLTSHVWSILPSQPTFLKPESSSANSTGCKPRAGRAHSNLQEQPGLQEEQGTTSTVVLVRKSPAWLSAVDAVLEPLLAIAPLKPIQSFTPNTSATASSF